MNDNHLSSFGLSAPAETLFAFHEVGRQTLEFILHTYAAPGEKKTLKTWGINSASEMVGRTTQSIRRLEEISELPNPKKDEKGRRIYTLADINKMRDVFGTRYIRPINSKPMILPVTNFKGGVSKTTTALLLGQKCALEGLRVLFIDLDPQATLTLLMGYIPDIHLTEDDTIATSLVDDATDIHRVIKKTYFHGIDIIPGGSDLQHVELILPNNNTNNIKSLGLPLVRLKQALKLVEDQYDMIIIDCGPNVGALTINAVVACNGMLIPLPPSMLDFGSFVRFTRTLSELFNQIKPTLDFFRILISKHPGTKAAKDLVSNMRQKFGGYMLTHEMIITSEVVNTANALHSIYEKNYLGDTKTYRRALDAANAVNNEMLFAFKEIWRLESEQHKQTHESISNSSIAEMVG